MESQKSPESTEGRTLSITRLLDAPRDLVWEVWTNPEHIKNWWGPEGFRNTSDKMEVRPGGEWQFTMHGPDGTDYRNVHVYVELVKPERIVLQHVTGPKFVMTATFVEETGGKTRVHLHSLFESAEQLAHVIQVFKADVGMKQNVDRLEAYLSEQSTNLSHSKKLNPQS
ncbi:MAG: SRPBCC family protein [Saprospiraceae bacterium]|nr:SRPBCC family protein [Saprospiraceae bacterium]